MRVKTDSISKYLREKKGVTNARPGKKSKCPDCGKNTLYIKPNDEIATCFHPAHPGCNYWIVKSQEIETVDEVLQSFFTELELVGRATFRRQLYAEPIGSLETKKKSAIEYFRERGINEDVLENWPVAIVPHKSMIKELLKTHFSPLEKKFAQSNQDEQELEKLKNIRKKLDLLKNQSGSLLFLYSNLSGFTGFRLRKPYEPKDKAFTSQWFYEQHGCLWLNHQISPAKSKKVFLFEGEMDLLSFFSLGGKINDTFILTTCGSATSVDVETITKLSLAPFVFADNDDAGKKMIETMGKDVNVRQVLIPKEFNDIDDWISSFSSKPEAKIAILKAIQNPAWTYRAWDSVREEVNQIRARGADTGLEREQKAQERVQVELRLRGTFYRSGPQGYYHDRKSGILCAVPSGKKLRSHLLRMGVNSKSAFGKETMEFLEVNVSEMARQSKVYKFVHYDKETSQLYISVESGRVIVCSAEGPRVESNGTDGVLFVGDQILVMCPDFGDPSTDYALLDEVLCNINFSVTDLSISQQTALYKLWLISTFFPEIMPTKVIPSLIGPKQSGKSQCLKNFGRLLFGNKFNVVPLPDDPKEFDVIATNSHLCLFDNVDTYNSWISDKLCSVATGGKTKRRKLYTNDEIIESDYSCFIAFTTRQLKFRRDDVVDRLSILHLDKRESFVPETELDSLLEQKRPELLRQLVFLLCDVCGALKDGRELKCEGKVRMADFYSFALKTSKVISPHTNPEELFEKHGKTQGDTALAGHPVVDRLVHWAGIEENSGRLVTAAELVTELADPAGNNNRAFKSAFTLSTFLTNQWTSLENLFELSTKEGSARKKWYSFKLKPEVAEEMETSPKNSSNEDRFIDQSWAQTQPVMT